MTTELTKFVGAAQLPADVQAVADALGGAIGDNDSGGGGTDGVDYLDFSGKRGSYNCGKERKDLDPEDLFMIGGPNGLLEGWTFWKNNKVLKRHMWQVTNRKDEGISQTQIDADHVEETTRSQDGWAKMRGFLALPVDAETENAVQFTTNSKSGRNSVDDLTAEMRERLLKGEPAYPVFSFDKKTFVAQGETNYKPVFTVEIWVSHEAAVSWLNGDLSVDDLLAGVQPEPVKAEPAPKKKRASRAKKVEPAPDPEVEQEEEAEQEEIEEAELVDETPPRTKSRRKSRAA